MKLKKLKEKKRRGGGGGEFKTVKTKRYIVRTVVLTRMHWDFQNNNFGGGGGVCTKKATEQFRTYIHNIHTKIYSRKKNVANCRMHMSSSQLENRTMFLICDSARIFVKAIK